MIKENETLRKYIRNLQILALDEFDKLQDPSLLYFIQGALKGLIRPKQYILTTSTYRDNEDNLEKVCSDFNIE